MSEYEDRFEEEVQVDPFRLDDEWINQANLYGKYADLAAQARKDLDQAHQDEKTTRSEIILELREEDPKMTAMIMEARYRSDPRHRETKRVRIQAEFLWNRYNNRVYAFTHRKTALENLVRLWAGEYFGTPVADRTMPEGYEKEVKQTKAKGKITVGKRKPRRKDSG